MVQNGEPILIDLDTLCVGHPVFELGSMYNAFVGFAETDSEITKKFMGFEAETAERFWKISLKKYLGTEDDAVFESVQNKARVIGYTRLLRRSARRLNEDGAQEKIKYYTEKLTEVIGKVDTLEF